MGDGRVHQFSDEGCMQQFPHAKKLHEKGQTHKLTNGHRDSMIESAQWADSMKIDRDWSYLCLDALSKIGLFCQIEPYSLKVNPQNQSSSNKTEADRS